MRAILLVFLLQALATPAGIEIPQGAKELVYSEVDGRQLKLYAFEARGERTALRPAVITLHGGGWTTGDASWTFPAAERFAALGYVGISVDYRLSSGATTPLEALEDVCAALRWVRRNAKAHGIDPRRVAIYGVSAGGHLAALAATRGCGNAEGAYSNGGPDLLLLWSPALEVATSRWFVKLLKGSADPAGLSPLQNITGPLPPTSIVHGEEDTLTPLKATRQFCESARAFKGDCEVHAYPGVGHLLTRDLRDQEDNYDPDPAARSAGIKRHSEFLAKTWP